MQAVILAGGFGTRLAHVVKDVLKPMAPINNIPFLKILFDQLSNQGINRFIFLTGYKSEIIEEYFKDYKNITIIKEQTPLGTGGALLNAYKFLDDEFLLFNGDTFFDIDLNLFIKYSKDNPLTLALRFSSNIERYGFVSLDNDRQGSNSYLVKNFIEKGNLSPEYKDGYINGGIYFLKKRNLDQFYDTFKQNFVSFEQEIIPYFLKEKKLYALPMGGMFIDIGIPEDYKTAQHSIPEWIKKEKKPALFIDKDGTIIEDTGYTHGTKITIIKETTEMLKKYSQKGYHIIMITNQAGIAKNKFTIQDMTDNIDSIVNYYKKEGVIFDDIEYCLYHPQAEIKEYKYISLLRKPEPGMLLKASEKIKIDFASSIFFGDNKTIDNINLPYLKSIIR